MASARLGQVASHLSGDKAPRTQIGVKNPDDVVIVQALRTPITRAGKGGFKDTTSEYLLGTILRGVVERTGIDPALVEDICVGNVCPPAGGATTARMAALYAGFPHTTSVQTVNRQCSSGLQAVVHIAHAIQSGMIDIGIGAGVESMTQFYGPKNKMIPDTISDEVMAAPQAADCLTPMGFTSENVAKEFGVARTKQDAFAALSHQRAAKAQKEGLFDAEIYPVKTKITDKDGNEQEIVVTRDDGVRAEATAESLSKLRPAFSADGFTTAGNASQVSDGAAAVLLMKRSRAVELRLPIQGKLIASAVAGVPPRIMGVGPAYAVPAVLKKTGLTVDQLEIVELNEAFASQAVYSIEKLGLDINKVNPKGGAIAFGHPLGCTGARQISTLLTELKRQNKRVGCTTMCIGGGFGMAAIFESEH
ncbi:3-ketoacyl-CoA thiolase with broad chain length specificity [Coemansia sp. RSA 2671]|uniref:3-ketoacyl-CoA thiolase with broad chain length specificity n=2 Tax=Coemansia TaxID=4863 RepID=A0A9W8L256_9FUNG|nr:3-ketoacyl-CoA thiolase with broad chain length specificity [Coemansia sp. RSA 2675]KAJ2030445.1 3-ketoacyl-CoA thiolase with broad chain length specificity [Coemansia sp. S610]KAJ2346396.1 3-ketoacyl-CoA thiolase with broad chain length specificity [Coemansia sp. RSA 2671]KAJ2683034.1 3-ketoacyl-CoA thiolase with broad chain length specificity [Coemansia spiralis]KAJ2698967.1 3-ketoacyl-CoA thiolase with broad chain length specificity [Coemansia sp. IMI 209128]